MNNIILYFPWGGAGNLVRNIISIDTRFEFLDDRPNLGDYPTSVSRYKFLLNYYNKPVEPSTWLPREWSLRTRIHARYYDSNQIAYRKFQYKYYDSNQIAYWNPEKLLVYDIHGSKKEIDNILDDQHLKHFNRWDVDQGHVSEQISSWTLKDCTHVFLIPSDIPTITKIYNSKNPTIGQLEHNGDLAHRQREAEIINTTMCNRLTDLAAQLKTLGKKVHVYDCVDLYRNATMIKDIVSALNLSVKDTYINVIHSVWLRSTQQVYYNYFMTTFPI